MGTGRSERRARASEDRWDDPIAAAVVADLFFRIGRCVFVETGPAFGEIVAAALVDVDARLMLENGADAVDAIVRGADADQRAAATYALGIDVCFGLRHAGIGERAEQAA